MDLPSPIYPFSFEGPIVVHEVGRYRYTVLFLDPELVPELPFGSDRRLRVSGEVAEQPFEGALQPVRGRWYVMLSKDLMRDGGLQLGDVVEMRFRVDDPTQVEVPPALAGLLAADGALREAWEGLPPGRQRGVVHHVLSAKTAPTRDKRLDDAREAITAWRGDLKATLAARRSRRR